VCIIHKDEATNSKMENSSRSSLGSSARPGSSRTGSRPTARPSTQSTLPTHSTQPAQSRSPRGAAADPDPMTNGGEDGNAGQPESPDVAVAGQRQRQGGSHKAAAGAANVREWSSWYGKLRKLMKEEDDNVKISNSIMEMVKEAIQESREYTQNRESLKKSLRKSISNSKDELFQIKNLLQGNRNRAALNPNQLQTSLETFEVNCLRVSVCFEFVHEPCTTGQVDSSDYTVEN
jgi:hypothetical protein